jgi:general secretion pathway protein E
MGVEPFLLSSSLLGTLAQRLVRKLCPKCKREEVLPDGTSRWHPVGCPHCAHTGYKGRTGVYEMMVADERVQALIHNRAPEQELRAAAAAAGLLSMREDGERLVAQGITSLEEVVRVTRD